MDSRKAMRTQLGEMRVCTQMIQSIGKGIVQLYMDNS